MWRILHTTFVWQRQALLGPLQRICPAALVKLRSSSGVLHRRNAQPHFQKSTSQTWNACFMPRALPQRTPSIRYLFSAYKFDLRAPAWRDPVLYGASRNPKAKRVCKRSGQGSLNPQWMLRIDICQLRSTYELPRNDLSSKRQSRPLFFAGAKLCVRA